MIPIKEWINNLIAMCARTDTTNVFRHDQVMDKNILIKNYDIDYSEVPTQSSTGTTHSVIMVDKDNNTLGSIDFFRTNTEALGLRFHIGDHALGIKVTDEGEVVSFVDHPNPEGNAFQIATMGYVDTIDTTINTSISQLHDSQVSAVADLNSSISTLRNDINQTISQLREYVNTNISRIDTINNIEQLITTQVAEKVNYYFNRCEIVFGEVTALFTSNKTSYTYTPAENGILVLGWDRGNDGNLRWFINGTQVGNKNKNYIGEWVSKGTGDVPVTFALKAGSTYKWECDEGLTYAYWVGISLQVQEDD